MNTEQALAYEKAVVKSAFDWAINNGTIDSHEDLLIICEHYKMYTPAYLHYFKSSDSRRTFKATGAYANISKFLDRLALRIIEIEKPLNDDSIAKLSDEELLRQLAE